MRNHVHILACKIHIDIITYILNKYLVFFLVYKNTKDSMTIGQHWINFVKIFSVRKNSMLQVEINKQIELFVY